MLLMIIAFLSIVLFVTLVISQNHMKKFMWKDVPNPNNCSWAQGIDFRKADTMEQLFRHPEGLPAWPLLLVSETISQATIMEKTGPPISGPDKDLIPASSRALCVDSEVSGLPEEEETLQLPDLPRSLESSAQPSVTYATVLLSDDPHHLYKQEGSLSSSSDEGNFSGNNSDISGSFPGNLWELENSHSGVGELDLDPRRSCSYNSVEEFSETSEQEDEALGGERDGGMEVIEEKDLYYLGMGCQEESEEEEEEREEDTEAMLLKEVMVLGREGSSVESIALLGSQDSMFSESSDEGSVVEMRMRSVPCYLPQFRTAPSSPLKAQDSTHQL